MFIVQLWPVKTERNTNTGRPHIEAADTPFPLRKPKGEQAQRGRAQLDPSPSSSPEAESDAEISLHIDKTLDF